MVVAVRRLANRVVLELLCKADLQLGQSSHSVVAYAQASSGDIGPAVLQSTQARPPADVVLLELASREAYLATADALLEGGRRFAGVWRVQSATNSASFSPFSGRGSDALDFARRWEYYTLSAAHDWILNTSKQIRRSGGASSAPAALERLPGALCRARGVGIAR
eukprot:scaffold2923_cov313-Pinguiococcus_pyrenoidosus.AAC.19